MKVHNYAEEKIKQPLPKCTESHYSEVIKFIFLKEHHRDVT